MKLFPAILDAWCQTHGYPEPEAEYRFDPARRWRLDFAWPRLMVALECEGGVWKRGRHTRPQGYAADCEKYSEAAIVGWCVVRCTWEQISEGSHWDMLERAFKSRGEKVA